MLKFVRAASLRRKSSSRQNRRHSCNVDHGSLSFCISPYSRGRPAACRKKPESARRLELVSMFSSADLTATRQVRSRLALSASLDGFGNHLHVHSVTYCSTRKSTPQPGRVAHGRWSKIPGSFVTTFACMFGDADERNGSRGSSYTPGSDQSQPPVLEPIAWRLPEDVHRRRV